MQHSFRIELLTSLEDMLTTFDVLQDEYPSMTFEHYSSMLQEMIPANYAQIAVYDGDHCVGVSGYWINTKLWCGRYLELDNIVVATSYRSKGVGKIMIQFLEQHAAEKDCKMLALDSYTTNFKAHKLFYNTGFIPRGFHFIKFLGDQETDANGYRVR